MAVPQEFLQALPFPQRAPELAEGDDIFGWMIGSWEMDAVLYDANQRTQRSKGEVHASWVLEGRAIQDLFIFPRRADRRSGVRTEGDRYGTTIRTYDHKLRAWRVHFINPAAQKPARSSSLGAMETTSKWKAHFAMALPFAGAIKRSHQTHSTIQPRGWRTMATPGSFIWNYSENAPVI